MSLVLAIEPDHRQGAVLKRIIREHVHADLLLVDSPDAAIATFSTQLPDVILLSAFLAPADEDDLLEKLRSLDGGSHIQTYTIPQFIATKADEDAVDSGGFFGRFRKNKKKAAAPITGCDPDAFAQEVVTFVARAHELRSQSENAAARALRLALRDGSADTSASTENVVEPTTSDTEGSSWASPFEWRRTGPGADHSVEANPASAIRRARAGTSGRRGHRGTPSERAGRGRTHG